MYCKIIIKKLKAKNSKIKYNYTMENWVAVIDLKAYYATFQCLERGLDPFTTPLAVTDTTRKESTIVLSVPPYLKSLGVVCSPADGKICQKVCRSRLNYVRFCWKRRYSCLFN